MTSVFTSKNIIITESKHHFTQNLIQFICKSKPKTIYAIGDKNIRNCPELIQEKKLAYTLNSIEKFDILIFGISLNPLENKEENLISHYIQKLWEALKLSIPKIALSQGGSIVILPIEENKNSLSDTDFIALKHALIGLMRTVAIEASKLNVQINMISFEKDELNSQDLSESFIQTLEFLCSKEGKLVTGSEHSLKKKKKIS